MPSASRGGVRALTSPTTARILFPFVVIAVWYWIYYTIDSRIFPTPLEVLEFMWEEITLTSGVTYSSVATNLYGQFGISILRLTIGFTVAVILGTAIGLGMGVSKRGGRLLPRPGDGGPRHARPGVGPVPAASSSGSGTGRRS